MEKIKNHFSSILSCSLGNVLEWYDFGLFAIFSVLFSHLFFPPQDPQAAFIATLTIFAIGFLCRPIGALLFGFLGDTRGRAQTLRLSILMISLPTLLIGLLPTYQQIGLFAPVLLMLIRMWQGISIGGEYSGNLIYLAETAPASYRATFTALASTGANLGILLAALAGIICSYFFNDNVMRAWGWRVPYLLSGIFSLLVYFFRLRIQETTTFTFLKEKKHLVKNPIRTVFKVYPRELLRTLGLVCMGSTFYYFCFVYIPMYLSQTLYLSIARVSTLMTLLIGAMIILAPIAGFICDRVGRRKMLLFNASLVTLIVIPGFYFLQFNQWLILVTVMSLFTIASSLEQGTTSIAVVENFPAPARYTGVSLGYNLGNGLLGGTVPIVCGWLLVHTQMILMPALYVASCALITLLTVYFFIPFAAIAPRQENCRRSKIWQ